ncbi:hypothetical protein CROQUDRAFT_669669 [Cronartium quercuum f. sp. fusiforme G11]|uniref:Uncharacterized protein n=1 Tax=Cronartium quercuum f. sp. fusiforme G11 TaxID=708437 RepID=A0A9P6TDU6_9BASI|nr:hypothetical protein CROQUDRAFT_669669 [Cronartium quercuum f. sp. fusiforme G11]
MAPPRISTKRLHILYTTPLILGLASFFLIWIPLFCLVPWRSNAGTVLRVEHVTPTNANVSNDILFQSGPTLYFGLLGSCYQPGPSAKLECTPIGFPPDYARTMALAGPALNAEHLEITMPDLPPVFIVWALVSLVALILQLIATLPLYSPTKFKEHRFLSKPLFSASLWILGIAWAFGFSAVLSLACFVQGFGDEYNTFSLFYILNHARSGPIFYLFAPAMFFQILVGLSFLIAIENAPTREKEAFADSWSAHVQMSNP